MPKLESPPERGAPAARLAPQPWMTAPSTLAVLDALTGAGGDARFVGGCVRDALIGKAVKDVDIATTLVPDEVLRRLETAGIKVVPTGLEHGTVTAVSDHHPIEVTTLRRDVATDGRRATVEFTTDWSEDAARRDLTFNALFCDRDGRLYDFYGGREDLRLGRVRFIGDPVDRIAEDRLRILRYFRFYAYYGEGPVDLHALEAARAAAPEIAKLSGERVCAEMLKLLGADEPASVLTLMDNNAILAHALPGARDLRRLKALVTVEGVTVGSDRLRRLAALLPSDPAVAEALAARLRLSRADGARLVRLAAPDLPDGVARLSPDLGDADRERAFYRLGAADSLDLVLLAWAETLMAQEVVSRFETEQWRALLRRAQDWEAPVFPLRGADVTALGVAAGPEVGALLREIEAEWVAARFAWDREACLARLAERAGGDAAS